MGALLALHVAAGTVALTTGPVAMLSRKGGTIHVAWGRVFGVAMLLVALSSLVLGVAHNRQFLVFVGLFTLQLLLSGYRALRIRRDGVARFDLGLQIVALGMGVGFLAWGVRSLLGGDPFGYLALGFGVGSAALATRWIRLLRSPATDRTLWLRHHLIGMGAAYIATATAALVVNVHRVPSSLPFWAWWILPTVLGAPLIGRAARRVRITRRDEPMTAA